MKIIPYTDILIEGQHAEAGKPFDTSERTAQSMVAQGFAKFAPKENTKVEKAEAKSPSKETAAKR